MGRDMNFSWMSFPLLVNIMNWLDIIETKITRTIGMNGVFVKGNEELLFWEGFLFELRLLTDLNPWRLHKE